MCPGFVEFHFWINCKDVRVWVSLGWFITVSLSVQHSGHWRLSLLEPRVGSRSDSLATFDTASTLLTAATLRTRRYCPSRDTGGDDRELGAQAGPGPRPGVREFLGWTQGDTRRQMLTISPRVQRALRHAKTIPTITDWCTLISESSFVINTNKRKQSALKGRIFC